MQPLLCIQHLGIDKLHRLAHHLVQKLAGLKPQQGSKQRAGGVT